MRFNEKEILQHKGKVSRQDMEAEVRLTAAGEAANRAAADYLFADYRQRRAKKTIRTQTAALILWVQYLSEVGAAGELLAGAKHWALINFDDTELEVLLPAEGGHRWPDGADQGHLAGVSGL